MMNFEPKMIKVMATKVIGMPALSMSLTEIAPVENAIAFGGDEMGSGTSKEQERATATTRKTGFSPGMLTARGIKRFAAAVLLMKVDSPIANRHRAAKR